MTTLRTRPQCVYVDDAIHPFGRMLMCHMFSRSEDALLAMVDKIGVARKWIQRPPKASWVHFDISKGKRELAIVYGAVPCDRYECLIIAAEQQLEWTLRIVQANGRPPEDIAVAEEYVRKKRDMVAKIRARD